MIKSPWFITGLVDAEGTFTIPIDKNRPPNWRVQAKFQIGLHVRDLDILLQIKSFFKDVGSIGRSKDMVFYSVSSLKDLIAFIIPHFSNYSLLTQKAIDFSFLKKIVNLMKNKDHLTSNGLIRIVNMKAAMNRGLSDFMKISFAKFIPTYRPVIDNESIPDPYWVSGFVSGEGTFDIKLYKSNTSRIGYSVQLRFRISQHSRDAKLIDLLKKYFNSGVLEKHTKFSLITLVVVKFSDITDKIIPFFEMYPILGIKKRDYSDWCKVARLMNENVHLTRDGLDLIRKIRSSMNKGRKW